MCVRALVQYSPSILYPNIPIKVLFKFYPILIIQSFFRLRISRNQLGVLEVKT